jgi:thymidine kinase
MNSFPPNEYISKQSNRSGWIEVICGSMFSGKTEELIRRLKRAKIANQRVMIFKSAIDTRYDQQNIVSHDHNNLESIPVAKALEILELVNDAEVVGIDEAQFFDLEITSVCNQLANQGVRVVVAGLDIDYLGQPFAAMPALLAIAEYVTKVQAVCLRCGQPAYVSHRKVSGGGQVVLGEKDIYEPLCRACYNSSKS